MDLIESSSKKPLEVIIEDNELSKDNRIIKGLSEHVMKKAEDLLKYIERADTIRKIQASEEQDKDISLKMHTFLLFNLYSKSKKGKSQLSRIQFVELAGSEQERQKRN